MSRKLLTFLAAQAFLIALALAWTLGRAGELEARRALPELRPEPLELKPLRDDPGVVSDEQLRRVLSRLWVRFAGAGTSVGHVDHMLRAWGARADPGRRGLMSGDDMLRLLLDHDRFLETYGDGAAPLLIDDGEGVRVRVGEGTASSAHVDHLVATLAEIGTPSGQQIVTPTRRTTYRALLEQSLRDFSLNQAEYEWSALTYALFLPTAGRWRTSEGQEVSFDRLAERLMRERVPNGVCSGNHRLYALVVLLRVDEWSRGELETQVLSDGSVESVTAFLRRMTEALARHQHPQGFWNFDWPTAAAGDQPTEREGDRLGDRLIATGHALEWWAMAPEELLPPPAVTHAAGQWLVAVVDALSDDEIQRYGSYLSHVGRALALWRGRLPAEVELGS